MSSALSPVRRQYLSIKRKHPDAILLFRLGDFYETFEDDARIVARVLDITLTARELGKGSRVPLAGIPYHALESYLGKLVRAGYNVAICEQLSDPAASRGLVDRDVVRVVTPGTVQEPSLLEQKTNNYLAAVVIEGDQAGLSYVDISTGEFATTQIACTEMASELERIGPVELLVLEDQACRLAFLNWVLTPLKSLLNAEQANNILLRHFGVSSLEPYGCQGQHLAIEAAAAIISYLSLTQQAGLPNLEKLTTYRSTAFMVLDPQTRRNLGLLDGRREKISFPSLVSVLDMTVTPLGARLLRRWVGQPLRDLPFLERRQEAVTAFYNRTILRADVRKLLRSVADLERLSRRIASDTATPREMVALGHSLRIVPQLRALLEKEQALAPVLTLVHDLSPIPEVEGLIGQALMDNPLGSVGDGSVIRPGYSKELDDARAIATDAREYLASLEKRERDRTGISSLKVGYNRIFGYYLEVSRSNLPKVPSDYTRRQTLVGAERFIIPELKEYEARVLTAREYLTELEQKVYRTICRNVAHQTARICGVARAIATLDVVADFAEVAVLYGYVRPILNEKDTLSIIRGRHPVVEKALPKGTFVPNDTHLNTGDSRLILLTGPNMSGKSTYIRQVALIVLLAQIGSYVPAQEAIIGIVDRVFTRVGLQDDLAMGQSTFMVEMVETAGILHHATRQSLVILDEIGRGTSTYDGLAIAWAVAEHLHNDRRLGCRTLFATHYHELADLEHTLSGARNSNVAVVEEKDKIVFLHRIVPGAAGRSYGVHVARLAGLPPAVLQRAWQVLGDLENRQNSSFEGNRGGSNQGIDFQVPLPDPKMDLVMDLLDADLSNMTPLEALTILYRFQEEARSLNTEGIRSPETGEN